MESLDVENEKEYKQITIKLWNKGVFLRKNEIGAKIKTKRQFKVHSGDFIMSKIDARQGAFGVVPTELNEAITTGNFFSFEVNKEIIDIVYFNQFVSSPEFWDICEIASSGTTQRKYLNLNIFLDMEIDLPPLEEAEKQSISIQSESDRLLQDISDFRQEILTRAFRGDLTEQNFDEGTGQDLLKSIQLEKQNQPTKGKKKADLAPVTAEEPYDLPPNWTWTRLGEVSKLLNGDRGTNYPKTSDYTSSGVPFLSAGDLIGDYVDYKKCNFISESKYEKLGGGKAIQGDILYCLRGTIGKMGVFKSERAGISSTLCIIRSKSIPNVFMKCYLKSDLASEMLKKYRQGSAQPSLSSSNVSNYLFPLPPLAEQERIVSKIEAIFAALDIMEDAIKKQKDEAKSCYEEILKKEMETNKDEKESEELSEEMMGMKVG